MPDDFISRNEFNGFTKTVQEGFSRVQENLTQASVKLDTLVNGRIGEARMIGEITGAIKAINDRLERHERESNEIRRMHDNEFLAIRDQIDTLKKDDKEDDRGRLKGWHQVAISLMTAIFAVWAARFFK